MFLNTSLDAEGLEYYLLGDVNCNMLPGANDHNLKHVLDIIDIYSLSQLIREPTRTTATELHIDWSLTNRKDKITHSNVVIDHSLVFMTRKSGFMPSGSQKAIETRCLKNFSQSNFLTD